MIDGRTSRKRTLLCLVSIYNARRSDEIPMLDGVVDALLATRGVIDQDEKSARWVN
jgi:hypothetical protein